MLRANIYLIRNVWLAQILASYVQLQLNVADAKKDSICQVETAFKLRNVELLIGQINNSEFVQVVLPTVRLA